ncbi:hypothetical protein ABBQ38_015385 [Trebouxia sp. C0009 RCD-2024]
MLPYRQSSLVQQPDGEIIRAVVDSATVQDEDLGIQFDLGLLGLKVAQEGHGVKDAPPPRTQLSLPALVKDHSNASNKQRGLTVTTIRKSVASGSPASPSVRPTVQRVQQPRREDKPDPTLSRPDRQRQQARKEALPTVSSVSPEAIPGLRRQASSLDPGQAKQREKGWGLSFKEPTVASPTRKEIEVSSPQADDLERVRQITQEKDALAQQRALTEQSRQAAEAEQREAAKQAKAAAKRAALEAAAAQRAEEARKRHEFMQQTNKMYKAALQQEEQKTPAFLRMQQEAQAKEAEEEAEKKRRWEEEVASKRFWFADIQGSLEAAPSTHSDDTPEEHPTWGSPLTLSPEASGGPAPQSEASQGSLGKAPGDEQKKKSRREWQQSLRSSNKFKSADAARGPWGLSTHSPKTERRLKYHQMKDAGCDPIGSDMEQDYDDSEAEAGMRPLDPLDDSNSLSDLARSMHHMQPFPAQSASDEAASTHGPLVQLMHNISKVTGSAGSAVVAAGEDVNTSDGEVVNHAATVSLGRPQGLEEMAESCYRWRSNQWAGE